MSETPLLRKDLRARQPILNKSAYDIAKDATTIYLPAAATLYAGLAVIWGFPFSEQVIATVGLVVTFLGVVLKISSNQYQKQPVDYDGAFVVNDPNPEKETFRFEFENGLSEMSDKDEVRLKVVDLLPKASQK